LNHKGLAKDSMGQLAQPVLLLAQFIFYWRRFTCNKRKQEYASNQRQRVSRDKSLFLSVKPYNFQYTLLHNHKILYWNIGVMFTHLYKLAKTYFPNNYYRSLLKMKVVLETSTWFDWNQLFLCCCLLQKLLYFYFRLTMVPHLTCFDRRSSGLTKLESIKYQLTVLSRHWIW